MFEDLNLYPKLKEKILSDESLLRLAKRIYRKTRSSKSVETYVKVILRFIDFLKVEKPADAFKQNYDWESVLNDWIDELVAYGVASSSINTYLRCVKKWLEVNLSKEEWQSIDWRRVELPSSWKVEQDKIPLKEHLRQLFDSASEKGKALITIAVSSGLRIGTIIKLKLKNVKVYDNGNLKSLISYLNQPLPENVLGLITVTPEITKERVRKYLTFCTHECLTCLLNYLRKRVLSGENLTPDSSLFKSSRSIFYVDSLSATKIWRNLLKTTGLERKARKWNLYRFHTLRKYFNTWCKLSGVQSDIVEFWLGHTQGVKNVYNMFGDVENPAVIKKLAEEYSKCIDALTIRIGEEKIKELEKKLEEEIKLRDEKIKILEEKLEKLIKEIQEIKRSNRTNTTYSW